MEPAARVSQMSCDGLRQVNAKRDVSENKMSYDTTNPVAFVTLTVGTAQAFKESYAAFEFQNFQLGKDKENTLSTWNFLLNPEFSK